MEKEKLFREFPPVSNNEWKEKVIADLKGVDYDKRLVWQTPEGFEVQPFYRADDIEKFGITDILPGDFPFLRGTKSKGNNWLVRQDIKVDTLEASNAKALDIRLKGVDSLGFIFEDDYVPKMEDIDRLLQNIRADVMELNFVTVHPLELVKIIVELVKKYNRDLDKIKGSVSFDPIRHNSLNGKFRDGKENEFALLEQLMQATAHLPNFQVLTVDGSIYHNSGSGIVTQLAFALAKGAEYLTYLTGKGFDIDQVAPKLRFHFAVGSVYFMEIAKFRAARYLWANIVNTYGPADAENTAMFIHCSNSEWNKTAYDPYVNMLRTTTETMSSTLAGVNSMTVLPFNSVFENTTAFSERIARNQQLLLKGESYFDKVADPAAGSYYIEVLTKKIIDDAWKLFLEVDEKGGYMEAFKTGFISEKIRQEAEQKNLDVATRKRSILGTNQYPNVQEHIDTPLPFSDDRHAAENTLKPYRGAEAFEKVRQKTDLFALKHDRPKVWTFTYGNLAMRNARAQFAANFFGCAGFEIVNNIGFKTIDAGIEAARKAKPDIVVICSADEDYAGAALEIFKALKENSVVVLAGYPRELAEQLKAEGFEHFIHVRSNVLEELKIYQQLLKVE